MDGMEPNALALEYQGDYGSASGDLNVFDLVNNPAANGECSVLGFRFTEEFRGLEFTQLGSLLNNRTDPLVVVQDGIQFLLK